MNPNHDEIGRFSDGSGGGGAKGDKHAPSKEKLKAATEHVKPAMTEFQKWKAGMKFLLTGK